METKLLLLSIIFYLDSFILKLFNIRRIPSVLILIGILFHFSAIILRGISIGHLPFSNIHEMLIGISLAIAVFSCLLKLKFKYKYDLFPILLVIIILVYALISTASLSTGGKLPSMLSSPWFGAHVTCAVIAYALFAVSFCISCIVLLGKAKNAAIQELLSLNSKLIRWGLGFFTLVILLGSFWAKNAWGTYWSWDPKETSALITWLVYFFYIISGYMFKWPEKKRSVISILGFIMVIFTFIGAGLLIPGLHSYK